MFRCCMYALKVFARNVIFWKENFGGSGRNSLRNYEHDKNLKFLFPSLRFLLTQH